MEFWVWKIEIMVILPQVSMQYPCTPFQCSLPLDNSNVYKPESKSVQTQFSSHTFSQNIHHVTADVHVNVWENTVSSLMCLMLTQQKLCNLIRGLQ